MTACSCKVGSIRIEVDGSKHDGIYNFLAKGLGDTIRCVCARVRVCAFLVVGEHSAP